MRAAPLLLISLCAFASGKAPVTHETLWMMKRVSSPAVSPDGRWVVFTLVEPSYNESEQASDLWIVPADASAKPRRLTATKSVESGVAWSPDGRRIAFSARREGDDAAQIYVLDIAAGGEAQRFTSLSTGASGPQWSPDGKQLLFVSRVYPGAADDEANKKIAAGRKARKYRARVYDAFPIRNWDRWLDDLESHIFVQPAEAGAKPRDLLAGTKLVAERGFGGATVSGGDDLMPAWTPDCQWIVFTASVNKTAAAYDEVVTHLYQAPAAGGEPKQLTHGKNGYSRPMFRPDGKALYAIRDLNNGKIYNVSRLVTMPWPGAGEPAPLTTALDSSVNGVAFSPDSRFVFLTAEESGLEKIYRLPAGGGQIQPVTGTGAGVYGSLQSASKASGLVLAALWGSAVNPAEVVRIDPATQKHTPLTEVNVERTAGIDWQPLRHFWFTSRRGGKIHNMIALPPDFDENKKYPLFVVIHGGPHSMWRDEITLRWNYHLLAAPGYVVLLTNYTGSTGFGEKFAQQIQGDPLRGPGEEVNEAADEAIRRFSFLDGTRQCAGGASYGGHLANWLEATTTRYRCLISHAGLINLESQWGTSDMIYHRELSAGGPVWEQGPVWREQNPIRYAGNFRTPILLTVGENDFRVPLNQTLEHWSVLQRLRIPSRLIVFPDANHWILKAEDSRYFFEQVHGWLEKHLKN
ncbi:MAG: S9 family peptidase [Acidobacteria bacterium]|nr:S9 family peptidase [Acidobacteriota bacterium]